MDDEDYDELLKEETDSDELEELEEKPEFPKRLPPQQTGRPPKVARPAPEDEEEEEEIDEEEQEEQRPAPTQAPRGRPLGSVKKPKLAQRRYAAWTQPQRTAVVHADSGEIIAEGMIPSIAEMWADLKNDIDEIKDTLGKM